MLLSKSYWFFPKFVENLLDCDILNVSYIAGGAYAGIAYIT